jgi:hypothetical protein
MKRVLLVTLCIVLTSFFLGLRGMQSGTATSTANSESSASGILVELFTSEGCSSCPPADELLRKLDSMRTIANNQIVVLGEHVDYWDGTGWRDRFSSREYTNRQQEYAYRLGVAEPYTPQIVVDGKQQFVGNNAQSLEAALKAAAAEPKMSVSIIAADLDGNNLILKLKTNPLPEGRKRGDLYVAVADNSDETQVHGGENSGRALKHVAVLRTLQKVAKVGPEGMEKDVNLRLSKDLEKNNLRVVAFVQESGNGRVLGSTVRILSGTIATR